MAWQPGSQWIFYRVSGTADRYMLAWTAGGGCQRYLGAAKACADTSLQLLAGTTGAASLVWEVAAVGGGDPVPAAVEVLSVRMVAGSISTVDVTLRQAATAGECCVWGGGGGGRAWRVGWRACGLRAAQRTSDATALAAPPDRRAVLEYAVSGTPVGGGATLQKAGAGTPAGADQARAGCPAACWEAASWAELTFAVREQCGTRRKAAHA